MPRPPCLRRVSGQNGGQFSERDIASGVSIVCHYDGVQAKKLRRSWATIRKAAGLGDDVTPQVLRRTCVTWLLQAGVPTWEVAGFVGMSEETVRAVYGHHSPDHQAKAVHSPYSCLASPGTETGCQSVDQTIFGSAEPNDER